MAYAVAASNLVLRIITLLCLATTVVLIATDTYKLTGAPKAAKFSDVISYRYVFATALIGLAYMLFQLPLAIYHVCTEKRLISKGFLVPFDFYADKVMSILLATGVGVGFGVSFELKSFIKVVYPILGALGLQGLDEWRSKSLSFLDRGNIATALLFVGLVSMVLLSILSSITLASK